MTLPLALLTICLVLVAAWPLTAAYQYIKRELT